MTKMKRKNVRNTKMRLCSHNNVISFCMCEIFSLEVGYYQYHVYHVLGYYQYHVYQYQYHVCYLVFILK